MPINIIADKADELPEPIRASAQEQNGKFVVSQLPDGWGVAHEAGYKTKLTKAEQDARRASERLRGFAIDEAGNIPDPDSFKALLAEHKQLKEAQGKLPNIDELRKQTRAEVEAQYQKKLSEAESGRTELDRALDNAVLNAEINALVAQLRPKDGKADLVKLLLRDRLTLEKSGAERKVRVKDGESYMLGNGSDGFMPAKDYAMNVVRAQLADILEAEQSGGAGATSSGSRRPHGYSIKASEMSGNLAGYEQLKKRAAAEGKTVEVVDG